MNTNENNLNDLKFKPTGEKEKKTIHVYYDTDRPQTFRRTNKIL